MSRSALTAFILLAAAAVPTRAEQESVPTEALVTVQEKTGHALIPGALKLSVNDRRQPLTALRPVHPAGTQIAVLMDSGLRLSVARELDELRSFVAGLPDGVEVMVGSMQYGSVRADQPFTTDHAAAAQALHMPQGVPGGSGSPYLCLSDLVKKWPEGARSGEQPKARIVLMITNGVDPYNGSTSIMNQDSPYVGAAVTNAQRAGVAVYSIYWGGAGIGGAQANLSGQSYLEQMAEGTGGRLFYQGTRNPVSIKPFLDEFTKLLGQMYIASFDAPADSRRDLVRIKLSGPGIKVQAPEAVQPGNRE